MKFSSFQRLPLFLQTLLLLACTLPILWAFLLFDLHRLNHQARTLSGAQVDNLARAFAEEVKSSISSIDLTLVELRDEWQGGYNDFSQVVSRRQAFLEKDIGFQVAIINAAGNLVFSSVRTSGMAMNFADREHFRVHRGLAFGDRLFISKPVMGRLSKRWSIQFTRPLIDASGNFSGVIVLSVSPNYFGRFYNTIDLGKDGSITLARASGEILAQSPDSESAMGKAVADAPFLQPGQAEYGQYEGRSGLDDIERLSSWRLLPKEEMVVVVGQSMDTILASYRQQRLAYFSIGAAISVLLATIGYFLLAGMRQRAIATAALVDSEARWKFALEGAAEGVWDWDVRGGQVQFSRRWKEILGYADDAIGNHIDEWNGRIHPEDKPRVLAELDSHLKGAAPTYNSEHRMRCQDGGWKWVLERGMVVSHAADGQPLRMVGTFSDISQRKEAEQLDRERLQALEDSRRALQQAQKLEALGRLTGGIAHDFNNILQTLTTGIQLSLFSVKDQGIQTALLACQRAVERGVQLTRQLLVFGRVQEAHLRAVHLPRQMQEIHSLLRGALPSNIEFFAGMPETLWPVRIDPLQFELAMLNLTMNARDAMPQGGQFSISASNVTLAAAANGLAPGDYVHLRIRDTGEGMSEEVLNKALDPFFTTKVVGKGSGMGLAQAYGFASQMGGTLTLQSSKGEGLDVSIYLPRSLQEAPSAAPAARAIAPAARSRGRILLVEDDTLVSQTVSPALQKAGFTVDVADNGEEALRRLESQQPFDLVFSDIVMPGAVSGIELAEIVRSRFPAMRIMLATGYSERRVETAGIRTLAKPYAVETLVAALNEELYGAQGPADVEPAQPVH
ncbi:PAS domain-containing protein|uniref:PAS domain-containing protein n=1 Tax=Noviherbaspirillum sp. L7-7A TaxID=2850560 RepID=UPI001C2C0601|nr:PAS domain-containing protein [Noviherbaspirillum sp. L7-7A]MBV0881032.1 PAS domain-containing protein [Noviherbaspirillum sp. L7-7A]